MLNQILAAIPRVLSAALWIGIAFIAAKFLKSIIEAILPPTGFDDAIRSTGVLPATTIPSRVVANVAMVAIILVASIEAAKQLGGGTIALFLAQVTELGGKVIFGTLIIVAGIFLARIICQARRQRDRRGRLCPDDRQICDHRLVHRDRPDLHGPCRPDRDAGVRPDPRLGRDRHRARVRARRPRLGGQAARGRVARFVGSARRTAAAKRAASRRWSKTSPPARGRGSRGGPVIDETVLTAPPPTPPASGRGEFDAFFAIDWSGAKGRRHKGIAIAEARGRHGAAPGPPRPRLVARGSRRLAARPGREGAEPVRLRLQLRPADRTSAANICRASPAYPRRRANSGPMSRAAATTRTSAPPASSSRRTAAISISASPTA